MRRRRAAALAPLFLAVSLFPAVAAEPIAVSARPVPFAASDEGPAPARIGPLDIEGVLSLSANDARFGGLSGISVSPDGRRLLFVSDRGLVVTAMPRHDARGFLAGLAGATVAPLIGPDGVPVRGKRNSDAESLARFDGGFAVAFERRHRIWLYPAAPDPFARTPREIRLPHALGRGPPNGGIEALATLADRSLVAIAERPADGASHVLGWRRRGAGWARFRWPLEGSFRPSGATVLPGGDLLVLERRFSMLGGFAMRLVRVKPEAIRAGADVAGVEIARIEPPFIDENFEGIAAHRTADGRIRLYAVSDDNFHPLQRTLLVQFGLAR